MMTTRLLPHRPATAVLGLAAALVAGPIAAPAHAASSRVLALDGSTIRSKTLPGSELAGADAAPRAGAAAVSASAARARAPKKKKAKKKPYDLTVVRKAINKAGGAPNRRLAARAALTSVDAVYRASPKSSQAKRELEAVLKNTTIMARGNRITAGRMLMLTETLKRNAEWWKQKRSTGSGQRVQFAGSQMVWQYYPGSGMQLQWLGTFGTGNGLYYSGAAHAGELKSLVDEAIRLAVPRSGGIAWEYFFPFGGGSPPWVSGMAEATGIQVFSRASTKFAVADYLAKAKEAMTILQTPPPAGVQVVESTGTHFLIYSYAPGQKVLNAMNQTVNGLYAYVLAAPDDVDARLLFLSGLQWLDANVNRYDTGKWTLYQLGGPQADVHYHTVAKDFLKTLCALLKTDANTPGGGPSGAFPSTRICAAADTWTKYLAKK